MAEKIFGITDQGLKRDNNEDCFIADQLTGNNFIVGAVIDGVGGYEGGEIAAALAREAILEYLSIPSGDKQTMLREAVISANEKIFREKQETGKNERMSCVLTVVLVEKKKNQFYYAHVGDTRLYLLRDDSLVKITKDHSFVGYLEDSGRISESEAMNHPKRNQINKALGFADHISNPSEFVETGESPFLPGDLLMLCSDGLTDLVDSKKMHELLSSRGSLNEKASLLVQEANNAGGKDNITIVLIHNDARPLKQVATRPASVVQQSPVADAPPARLMPMHQEETRRSSKWPLVVLSILCIAFFAAFLYVLNNRPVDSTTPQGEGMVDSSLVARDHYSDFASLLQEMQGDTLYLGNDNASDTIRLTDNILIGRDSLVLMGAGKHLAGKFGADSPATVITIASTVKHLVLDSIHFHNISILVDPTNANVLRLKNVRFSNANMYATHPFNTGDSLVTGLATELWNIR